jgi:hypothetical protein
LLVFAPENDAGDQLINVRLLLSIAAPDNVYGRPERVDAVEKLVEISGGHRRA